VDKLLLNLGMLARATWQFKFLILFLCWHILFALLLGQLYAFTPDELGYLYTFEGLYDPNIANPQSGGGWIAAPEIFLRVVYAPAKLLTYFNVTSILAIRSLSILLTLLSIILLIRIYRGGKVNRRSEYIVLLPFLIPSVFLWTGSGMRESFLILELTLILYGTSEYFKSDKLRYLGYIFLGSYGLLSTKHYLWVTLVLAGFLTLIFLWYRSESRTKSLKFLSALFLLPIVAFAGTTSSYALGYIFHSNISDAGERSGDSITKVLVSTGSGGVTQENSGGVTQQNSGGVTQENSGGVTQENSGGVTQEEITFHGDYTLIALHMYIENNPNAALTRVMSILQLDKKIRISWNEKVAKGLISKSKEVGVDSSSLSANILEPGKISNPISLIIPSLKFLFAPIPINENRGFAAKLASFESPLWWLIYATLTILLIRNPKKQEFAEPSNVLSLIFLAGITIFSSLVEVNLGTAFRHRSVLLIPLIFIICKLLELRKSPTNDVHSEFNRKLKS
jgi:hypothetical protein